MMKRTRRSRPGAARSKRKVQPVVLPGWTRILPNVLAVCCPGGIKLQDEATGRTVTLSRSETWDMLYGVFAALLVLGV